MQRFSFGVIFLTALYVSGCANVTQDMSPAPKLWTPAAPITSVEPVTPATPATTEPVITTQPVLPAVEIFTAPLNLLPVVAENPTPHFALLLPLKSNSAALVHAAEIVQQGFIAAANVQQDLPVRVYASTDDAINVVTLYRQAIANGAVALAGPLTRDGVTALASYPDITIPTLALNVSEPPLNSPNLYFFGLPAENEARQIAQLAIGAKLYNATIISTGTTISKRLAAAFTEEWVNLGGYITAEVLFLNDFSVLTDLPVAPWPEGTEPLPASAVSATGEPIVSDRPPIPPIAPGNMVFLAADHKKARLIRPYLNPNLPVYATSQLFKGNTKKLDNYDLNDVRFVDMPWLLQPDHPAVMIYPRAATPLEPELDRLYALGIDAYRLVHILLTNRSDTALPLDGVTGRINLYNQQFLREGIPAFFRQGLGLTRETLAALNAAKAEEKAKAKADAEAEAVAKRAAEAGSAPPSPTK